MENRYTKIYSAVNHVPLKLMKGHFATNHSHTNYYLDITTLRTRQSEAREAAKTLVGMYIYSTVVDTIVCLEGTQVIGAYLADELTKAGFMSKNAHQTLYIVEPEYNSNSQMIFRDNLQPMINGKNVILLAASVTTGKTINKGVECISYYGGTLQGISAIFSAMDEVNGIHINSVFNKRDLPDYEANEYHICPLCKQGVKLDALVNSYGYSSL